MTVLANRYTVIKELGAGITGTVSLVKDEKTGLQCALKLLHAPLKKIKQSELETFKSELETLKNLNHPSIARFIDAGVLPDTQHIFLVTEFIDGQDIFDVTEQRHRRPRDNEHCELPEGKSIDVIEDLFVQALRALNYIHSKNIIHLDIKPQNMLVTENNSPQPPLNLRRGEGTQSRGGVTQSLKLIDFGFANFYERKFSKSSEGESLTVGTAPYLSPEVIKLENPPDFRADLYSLGCTFYKILTREVPFVGDDVTAIYYQHLYVLPKPLFIFNQKIPGYLNTIILKLMEKDPAKRYQSAQAVIEDLNLLSGKNYPIETPQTLQSYLLKTGKLIGRVEEFKKFEKCFTDRLYNEEYSTKPYLIIQGESGTGKTRFLEECKNYTQKDLKPVLSWKEFKSYKTEEEVPLPCLVIADEISFDDYDLEYLDVFFENLPILVLFSTSLEKASATTEQLIALKNFTKSETANYVSATTGLSVIPEKILNVLYDHTHGNPLYLTEYVRSLFEKGFLKDAQGSWSLQVLADLGSELENAGAATFIKNRLREKLESLNLQASHLLLLNTLALTGKPTLEDLSEITGAIEIEKNLKSLVEKNILEVDPASHYSFSNTLYKEVLLEQIPPELKEEICDRAADYFEAHGEPQEKVLYYRGRGGKTEAAECLLKLVEIKREQSAYQQAEANLLELVKKKEKLLQAYLQLGEINIEMGQYEVAENWLKKILVSDVKPDPLLYIKTLEQLGLTYNRRDLNKEARSFYEQGLSVLESVSTLPWMKVALKNRLAQVEVAEGNQDKAEQIFLEAWALWKNDLNNEEKLLAIRSDIHDLYFVKGDYQKVLFYLNEFFKVLSAHPSDAYYPVLLYKLGRTHLWAGQKEEGEKFLLQCLDILKDRKLLSLLYVVYNELGNFEEQRGHLEKALSYYKHTFELTQKISFAPYRYLISYNLATIYLKLHNVEEAKKYYNFALRLITALTQKDETQSTLYLYKTHLGLSGCFLEEGQKEKTKNSLKQAETLLQKHPFLKAYEEEFTRQKADFLTLNTHSDKPPI